MIKKNALEKSKNASIYRVESANLCHCVLGNLQEICGRDNRDLGGDSNPIAKIRRVDKFFKPFEEIGQANRWDSLPSLSEPQPFSIPILERL